MAGHHHIDADAGDRRVGAAIAVNLLLTVAQIVGGILAGSMALIADAIHNLSDAMALVIAFAAARSRAVLPMRKCHLVMVGSRLSPL